jgi:hypothetical protein
MLRHGSVVLLVVTSAFVPTACGADEPKSLPRSPPPRETAIGLLERWRTELASAFALQQAAGQQGRGEASEFRALRRALFARLAPIERYGADARRVLGNSPPSQLERVVIRTGDTWARWASAFRGGRRASDTEARRIAGLAVEAVRLERQAYRLAGRTIPREFRLPR